MIRNCLRLLKGLQTGQSGKSSAACKDTRENKMNEVAIPPATVLKKLIDTAACSSHL